MVSLSSVLLSVYFQCVPGKAISGFSEPDPAVRRHDGSMNALWQVLHDLARGSVCAESGYY